MVFICMLHTSSFDESVELEAVADAVTVDLASFSFFFFESLLLLGGALAVGEVAAVVFSFVNLFSLKKNSLEKSI